MTELLNGLIPSSDEAAVHATMTAQHLERLYVFALMWSLGALLELDDRAKMETFMQDRDKIVLDLPVMNSGDTIFEYLVDEDGSWQHWSTKVQQYVYPKDDTPEYASILVPNVDNVRTTFLINTIAKQEKAVLLIGEQGTAKTVMIKGFATRYDPEKHLFKAFNFSSASTPMMFQVRLETATCAPFLMVTHALQLTIESYVDKRVGSTYGPPAGRKMTIFVDDINMPRINEWGDQVGMIGSCGE